MQSGTKTPQQVTPRWQLTAPDNDLLLSLLHYVPATVAFLLTAWVGSSCVAAALQQQQQSFMTVALANVQARVETRYSWSVSATADPAAITVPVASNVGWPQVR